jgi:hypothetical protein
MTGAADGGFGRSGGTMQPKGRGTPFVDLSGKDLQVEIGALRPVDIFCNHAHAPPFFQARIGTA